MTLLIQKQPTNGYSTIANRDADTDTTATVPRTVRSWSGVVAIFAGTLLLVAGGGAVWLRDEDTAIGELVVATIEDTLDTTYGGGICRPATGTFGGVSTTSSREDDHFETCYQLDQLEAYCWTRSYYSKPVGGGDGSYFRCVPNGGGQAWHPISANSCGTPCQDVHPLDACFPAGGYGQDAYFKGTSDTTYFGKDNPFQTCYQYAPFTKLFKYCWSNSVPRPSDHPIGSPTTVWYECHPKPKDGQWESADPKTVVPYKTCGLPCQDMYPES